MDKMICFSYFYKEYPEHLKNLTFMKIYDW